MLKIIIIKLYILIFFHFFYEEILYIYITLLTFYNYLLRLPRKGNEPKKGL